MTRGQLRLSDLIDRLAPLAGLIVLCLFFAVTRPRFVDPQNLLNIIMQIAVVAVLAIAETFVIVAGGIDLSVGSVVALAGVVAALLMKAAGAPTAIAALGGVGAGALCGLISGLIISRMGLPPFIATLGMMGICRGVALAITDGQTISGLSEGFATFGTGRVLAGAIPIPVIVLIVVAILAHVLLKTTRFGRHTYALGSNAEATRLSGIDVKWHATWVFMLCGGLAGLAGIMLAARLTTGQPTAGNGYELDAIAAAVIGGASLMGGRGTIPGTLIGAFIMAVLHNGCDLWGVGVYWQQIVIGAIIVLAVFLDHLRQRRVGGA